MAPKTVVLEKPSLLGNYKTQHTALGCGAPEDTSHVLRCTAFKAQDTWDANLLALAGHLASTDTPTDLTEAICSRLTDWRADIPLQDNPHWSPSLTNLIHSQDDIGWKNYMEGLPSHSWIPYMAQHYSSIRSRLCPKKWLTQSLQATHHLAWSQWECRNKYLHEDGTPREKQALRLLQRQIIQEFLRGPENLPQADHHHFAFSLHSILSRSKAYKQAWILNVAAARHCLERRLLAAANDPPPQIIPATHSRLAHWIRTGRLQ
jgi:hypothetical protein